MAISKILKQRRESLGLKVKEVAAIIGVAESTYREWENGRKIQGEPYLALSQALEISIFELLGAESSNLYKFISKELEQIENCVKNIRSHVTQVL